MERPWALFSSSTALLIVAAAALLPPPLAATPQRIFTAEAPPTIYRWISENSYICSSGTSHDGSIITFMDEKEGLNCSLCPETPLGEIPRTACAIEVKQNAIDVNVGCFPIPLPCLDDLRFRYGTFYTPAHLPQALVLPGSRPTSSSPAFSRSLETPAVIVGAHAAFFEGAHPRRPSPPMMAEGTLNTNIDESLDEEPESVQTTTTTTTTSLPSTTNASRELPTLTTFAPITTRRLGVLEEETASHVVFVGQTTTLRPGDLRRVQLPPADPPEPSTAGHRLSSFFSIAHGGFHLPLHPPLVHTKKHPFPHNLPPSDVELPFAPTLDMAAMMSPTTSTIPTTTTSTSTTTSTTPPPTTTTVVHTSTAALQRIRIAPPVAPPLATLPVNDSFTRPSPSPSPSPLSIHVIQPHTTVFPTVFQWRTSTTTSASGIVKKSPEPSQQPGFPTAASPPPSSPIIELSVSQHVVSSPAATAEAVRNEQRVLQPPPPPQGRPLLPPPPPSLTPEQRSLALLHATLSKHPQILPPHGGRQIIFVRKLSAEEKQHLMMDGQFVVQQRPGPVHGPAPPPHRHIVGGDVSSSSSSQEFVDDEAIEAAELLNRNRLQVEKRVLKSGSGLADGSSWARESGGETRPPSSAPRPLAPVRTHPPAISATSFAAKRSTPPPTPPADCVDSHRLCCFWAVSGECEANPYWMRVNCAKTCGTCSCKLHEAATCVSTGIKCTLPTTTTSTTTTTTTTTTTPSTTTTRRTTTTSTTPTTTTTTTTPKPTKPPARGFRRSRPSTTTTKKHSTTTKKRTTPSTTLSSTTTTTPATTTTDPCRDRSVHCPFWAALGECDQNPFWMRPHCQKACRSCNEHVEDVFAPTPKDGCENDHKFCTFWAFNDECERNANWMIPHCPLSCNIC